MRGWYLSHKRTSKDQTRLHIGAVSSEPLHIAVKRKDVDEGSGKFYRPVQEVWNLSHMQTVANQARLHQSLCKSH